MNFTHKMIVDVLFNSIDEFNKLKDNHEKIIKNESSSLMSVEHSMDSLSLVEFILIVEDNFLDSFGISITIADDRAMSELNSPFKSIESLAKYLYKSLNKI